MNRKKYLPPILITILLILYYILYFTVLVVLLEGLWALVLGIFPLVFSGIMIYVCIDRIKEIKKGEEDDLSKY